MNHHNKEISRLRIKLSTAKKSMNNAKSNAEKTWHRAGVESIRGQILTHLHLKKNKLQAMMDQVNKNLRLYKNHR